MSARRITWCVAIACLTIAKPTFSQTAFPDSVIRRIDAVFARYTRETPGCALGVFQNGRVTLAKGYGLAIAVRDGVERARVELALEPRKLPSHSAS